MHHPKTKPLDSPQDRLRRLPSITDLLKIAEVRQWREDYSTAVVASCLRQAVAQLRQHMRAVSENAPDAEPDPATILLAHARTLLDRAHTPRIRRAINATGILLHTGLGRAVFAPGVIDALVPELKGYCTLAIDPATGERAERDELLEPVLTEITGAEAATVVNNNAAATMLVLAALAAHKEVVVSRGQLIEIGGSFRLPEVMAQSQARLVEVGATNRTHLKDYRAAVGPETAAILRVHPSNYRVVGFTSEVPLAELADLAHSQGILLLDDLGAGALVDLGQFGLPHEPTVQESIEAGADVVLFSGDKLIGGSQAGVIVGRRALIQRLRRHPLMRAVRADKTCLMILERTLALFRRPEKLRQTHPLYRMLSTSLEALRARAASLVSALAQAAPNVRATADASIAYLGSGSLPTEAIPSITVTVVVPGLNAEGLARRLRADPACVFGRIENDQVRLDLRSVTDDQVADLAAALARMAS